MPGRLESINVSGDGVPKLPVTSAAISAAGVEGDRQRDLRHHGGPDRAASLFSAEVIAALREEGHPISAGATGENLTISGIPWSEVVPGAELTVGDVRLAVTSYAAPCRTIRAAFAGGEVGRISQDVHPGSSRVYARVRAGGVVRVGDEVRVESRGFPRPPPRAPLTGR